MGFQAYPSKRKPFVSCDNRVFEIEDASILGVGKTAPLTTAIRTRYASHTRLFVYLPNRDP